MINDIKGTMLREFGMIADDKDHSSGKFTQANFGNMAEAIMAMCASSFILSDDGRVSIGTVEEIFINSLERSTKEKTYNLSGKNSIFDIKGASVEKQKAEMQRQEKAAIIKALEKVAIGNRDGVKVKWKNSDKSYYNELEKWKLQVNGKNVIALAFTAPKKLKTIMVKGKDDITLKHKEVINFFNDKIDSYIPGMIGDENGLPLKAAYDHKNDWFVKYMVADDKTLTKFMNESVNNEDNGFIPKLVISTNHNVIPTIQDILMGKKGEKYDELVNMMDTIVEYFVEGENDITKIRNIYQESVKNKVPSNLVIRMMGGDGQTSDGKGNVKGDIQLSIRNDVGNTITVVFSMKYGNHIVHSFSSNKTLVESVGNVYDIAGLDNSSKHIRDWKETVDTYGDSEVTNIVGITEYDPIFETTGVHRLYERVSTMPPWNKARMLFAFLERFAIGKDKASILRTDKNGKKWHVIPSLISDYLRYQDKNVFVNRNEGVNMKMGVRGKDAKLYGILKISDKVAMDGELEEFVEKVKKIFTQPRTDMWTLISYLKFLKGVSATYSDKKPVPKIIIERVNGMLTHTSEIQGKFPKTTLPSHKIIMNDLDSKEFKKSEIMTFMNGDIDSVDTKEISSFVTIMIDKIGSVYKVIKMLPVEK